MKRLIILIFGLILMFFIVLMGCRGNDETGNPYGTDAVTPRPKSAPDKKPAPETKGTLEKKKAPASGGYPTGGY